MNASEGQTSGAGKAKRGCADLHAPFVLLRIASLPFAMLEKMIPHRTVALLDAAEAAEEAMVGHRDSLTEALFEVVGRTGPDQNALRRLILQLKREVFALASTRLKDDDLAQIAAQLGPDEAELVPAYCHAAARRDAALKDAEQTLADERQTTIRPALRAALAVPLFADGLAMASPSIAAHARRETALPIKTKPDQFERSLLNYLIRTAAKTSPFSTFMATTVVPVEVGGVRNLRLGRLAVTRRCRLNRGLATAALIAQEKGRSGRRLSANPTIKDLGGGRTRAVVGRYQALIGRPWRQTSTVHFRLAQPVVQTLIDSPETMTDNEWRQKLVGRGLTTVQADTLVATFVERGLLNGMPLMDAFDPDVPPAVLTENGPLRTVARYCAELESNVPDRERLRLLAASDEVIAATLADGDATHNNQLRNTVLEDTWAKPGAIVLVDDNLAALNDLGEFLADQIECSPDHMALRQIFAERFGEGGSCENALLFLIDAEPILGRAGEYGAAPALKAMVDAPSGTPMPLTVQYQEIGNAPSDAPQLVVNKVFEGIGWLAARHAFGSGDEHGAFRTMLGQWLTTVANGREPVDFPICGECNDLQAHPRVTDRVLKLPGEPIRDPDALLLSDLRIVDDAQRGILQLEDKEGRPLEPVYLGGSLPSPTWGFAYGLAVLSRPYRLLRPPFAPPSGPGEAISLVERTVHKRVIIKRATWWLSTQYLCSTWFSIGGAARLRAISRECVTNDLPFAFFARRPLETNDGVIGRDLLKAQRKPLFVDIRNPFCLDLLEQLIQGVAWISFTEATPFGVDHALTVAGERHVSELQAEMVVHAA